MRLDGKAVSARPARLPCPSPGAAPAAARRGGTPHSLDGPRVPAARCGRGDAVARVPDRRRRRLARVLTASGAGRPAGFARLAAAALLALFGGLVLPAAAQAQSVITLVSNIDQDETATTTSSDPLSQSFTTGSNAYSLNSAEIVSADSSGDRFGTRVCTTDTNGHPTSTCTNLTPKANFAAGTITFSAPADSVLAPRTVYAVVVQASGTAVTYGSTPSDAEDEGKADGWSMANAYDVASASDPTSWTMNTDEQALRIAITGNALSNSTVIGMAITSSPRVNSSYETEEVIQVTATFSSPVTVDAMSGTPRLALTIGSSTRYANYSASASGSTATSLVFAYTVIAEDNDQDGISVVANALDLNGGAIHNQGDTSTNAVLDHLAVSTQSAHRVNRRSAIVSGGVAITSSPDANSSYETGDVIRVTVTFSLPVEVIVGRPRLALTIGPNTRYANYLASGSTTLVFAYTVVAEDHDQDGISIAANALGLNGGTIHNQGAKPTALLDHGAVSAQSGHRVNRDPFIVSGGVAVTSTPAASTDTYGVGEIIEISVTFSTAVNATTNTDFVLSVAGDERAPLLRGSGTETLVFGYIVQAGDNDTDGIWIGDQDRTLDGNRIGNPQNGAITSVATGRAALLTHGALGIQGGHNVDGSLTPVVTIAADKDLLFEEEDGAGFTLSRNWPAAALTVTVAVTQQEDRVLLPEGAAAERTVTFAVGSTTATLMVALDNDDFAEAGGRLTVEVQAGMGYTVGAPGSATVTVFDADGGRPTPANLIASPGAGGGEVVLSWDAHAPHLAFTRHQYRYKTDGNYAGWTDIPNSGQHYTGAGDGSNLTGYTVTGLVGGQLHTFQVRTFASTSDGTGDVSAPSNEEMATPRVVVVSFGAGSYSVDEGDPLEFTVTLSGAAAGNVTVNWATSVETGDTATSGTDFTAVPATTLTFMPGDTTATVTVQTTEDTTDEANETFTVTLSNPSSNVTLATDRTATGTIGNDDKPEMGFEGDTVNCQVEETGRVHFPVVLDRPGRAPITVQWETGDAVVRQLGGGGGRGLHRSVGDAEVRARRNEEDHHHHRH